MKKDLFSSGRYFTNLFDVYVDELIETAFYVALVNPGMNPGVHFLQA